MSLLVGTALRSTISTLDFEQAKGQQDLICTKVQEELRKHTDRWGCVLVGVDIQSIEATSKAVNKATEELVCATRKAKAEIERETAMREVALMKARTKNELMLAEAKAKREADLERIGSEADRLRELMGAGLSCYH